MIEHMGRFRYIARDREGKLVKGVMFSTSKEESIAQLRSSKLYVLQVKKCNIGKGGGLGRRKVISYAEMGTFCKQFSVLLKAGISIPQALRLISIQKRSSYLQIIISDTLQSLEQGETLYQGFSRYSTNLPPFFTSLLKAGEKINSLEAVFERLAVFYDEEDQFRKDLSQLMIYPVILLVSTLGVVAFLFLKIIPGFSAMYESFESKLPYVTYCLMSISQHLLLHFKKYLIGFLLCTFFLSYSLKFSKVNSWFIRWQYRLPLFGKMKKRLLIARLARTWGLLLSNGLEVLPAIEQTLGTVDELADLYLQQIARHLKQGVTFSQSLRRTLFFPDLFIEMMEIGEESGALAIMLARIAEIYEKEGRNQIESFLKLIEPVLLLSIACTVGIIVLAVMLPMFELIKLF